jgi:1,4-dihydroxy-6-naphthoate synthase
MQRFELGISPCPNDTFIFYALANGRIDLPFSVDLFMADVEQLNARARKADIAVTKLSVAAMVDALDNYILLRAGGALGYGCGPIMVAKENACVSSLANARIAIPGRMTTANMLLSLHGVHKGERVELVFDEVMPAVARGDVAAGVVIHEGRFTYAGYGLEKLFDLGKWWEDATTLPIPLGAIAVRRDLGMETALALEDAIRRSLAFVQANPEEARAWIKQHAQEMDDTVIDRHIETFVNNFSMELGEAGQDAIRILLEKAFEIAGRPMPDLPLFVQDQS